MKIYFFGGSFDPPHKAHKMIYKYCINYCDKFIFIPNRQSPGKAIAHASKQNRIQMLKLLIGTQNISKVSIDDFELNSMDKPNYTIDTILYLQSKFKGASLNMIIGGDQYNNLIHWKNYNDIIEQVNIVCFKREGFKKRKSFDATIIDFNYDISSTKIKMKLTNNKPDDIKDYLTDKVYNYIINKDLYRN